MFQTLLVLSSGLAVGSFNLLLKPCSSNADCLAMHSECKIISPSCSLGSCSCIPGFVANENGTRCHRAVGIGGYCDAKRGDKCVTEGSACSNMKCNCPAGQIAGPDNTQYKCALEKTFTPVGKPCKENSDCFSTNAFCSLDTGLCACKVGYKSYGSYNCIPKGHGDACDNDNSCKVLGNMACHNGACKCQLYAKKALISIKIWDYSGFGRQQGYIGQNACYLGDRAQMEGQSCDYGDPIATTGSGDYEESNIIASIIDEKRYCSYPYACLECLKGVQQCSLTTPHFVLASSAESLRWPFVLLLFTSSITN